MSTSPSQNENDSDNSIEILGLPPKLAASLQAAGINTVRQLEIELRDQQLLLQKVPGLGEKYLTRIRDAVMANRRTQSATTSTTTTTTTAAGSEIAPYQPATWEKICAYAGAGFVFILASILLLRNKPIADPTLAVVLRSLTSIGVASIGAAIPGFMHISLSLRGVAIRAGGALALFLLTFMFTPTILPRAFEEKLQKIQDTLENKLSKLEQVRERLQNKLEEQSSRNNHARVRIAGAVGQVNQLARYMLKPEVDELATMLANLLNELEGKSTDPRLEAAKQTLTNAQRLAYIRAMQLASRCWAEDDVALANELLDECLPTLRHWEWNYLKTLCQVNVLTSEAHAGGISGLAYNSDGSLLASCGSDKTIRIWNPKTKQETVSLTLKNQNEFPYSLCFNPKSEQLACGCYDGTVTIWDYPKNSPRKSRSIKVGQSPISCVAFRYDGRLLATGDEAGQVLLHDLSKAHTERANKHSFPVRSLLFSEDGTTLATCAGTRDLNEVTRGEVTLWNIHNHRSTTTKTNLDFAPDTLCFSKNGECYASGGSLESIMMWDVRTERCLWKKSHDLPFTSRAVIDTNCSLLATPSRSHSIVLWDVKTGEKLFTLKRHSNLVHCCAFAPHGKQLATATFLGYPDFDDPGEIFLWSTNVAPRCSSFQAHCGYVRMIVCSPDGKLIATGEAGTYSEPVEVRLWDAVTGNCFCTINGHNSHIECLRFSSDGRLIASLDSHGLLKVTEVRTGTEVLRLSNAHNPICTFAFSLDGKLLGAASETGFLEIWDIADAQQVQTFDIPFHIRAVSYNSKEKWLVAGGAGKEMKLWSERRFDCFADWLVTDASSGREKAAPIVPGPEPALVLRGHTKTIKSFTFLGETNRIASADEYGKVIIWDAEKGIALFSLQCGFQPFSLAISPDGERLVTSRLAKVQIWDCWTGKEVFTLRSNTSLITSVGFTPDSKRIVTGDKKGRVCVWDGSP